MCRVECRDNPPITSNVIKHVLREDPSFKLSQTYLNSAPSRMDSTSIVHDSSSSTVFSDGSSDYGDLTAPDPARVSLPAKSKVMCPPPSHFTNLLPFKT